MSAQSNFVEKISPILRHKSTVDGHEMEQIYFVSGGFGSADAGDLPGDGEAKHAGSGGGGVALPLGAYYTKHGQMGFHPNPITVMWASVPLAFMAMCTVRSVLRASRRNKRRRNKQAKQAAK